LWSAGVDYGFLEGGGGSGWLERKRKKERERERGKAAMNRRTPKGKESGDESPHSKLFFR
jgi:hypothetical protein